MDFRALDAQGTSSSLTSKKLKVIINKDEEMYVAECLEVGTVSQGSTIDEAVANLKEATGLYLEDFPLK